jgi:hypothetical protein
MGRHHIALASLLGALALAAPAAAQDVVAAEALYNRGFAEMQAGRFETGCPALGESYRLDPRPGTLFTLAECEAKRGRIATAVTRYGDYLSLFSRLPSDQQAKQKGREKIAASKKAELAPQVPELTLSLPPDAPSGTVVKRDEAVLAEAALGVGLPIDPGEHVVTTQAPGGPLTELRVTLQKGEKKQITLQVKGALKETPSAMPPATSPPPVVPPPGTEPPPPDTGSSGRRTGAFIAGGVGVAGLILGGVMGALALGEKGKADEHCPMLVCDAEGIRAVDSGRTFALVSTIGVGVGVAGVGAAVVLFLTAPSQKRTSLLLPGTTNAPPRKVSAAVWSAGNGGTVGGIQGAW